MVAAPRRTASVRDVLRPCIGAVEDVFLKLCLFACQFLHQGTKTRLAVASRAPPRQPEIPQGIFDELALRGIETRIASLQDRGIGSKQSLVLAELGLIFADERQARRCTRRAKAGEFTTPFKWLAGDQVRCNWCCIASIGSTQRTESGDATLQQFLELGAVCRKLLPNGRLDVLGSRIASKAGRPSMLSNTGCP